MSKKPGFGDLVTVHRDGQIIGQGVVVGQPIPNGVSDTYMVDTTFSAGWTSGDPHLVGIDPDHVTLVEEGWGQKWQKRVYGW